MWDGVCQAGERFSTSDCNNKLIGARYFVDGFGRDRVDPSGFLSPRDDDGHGSHTASTAAGNFGVDPEIDGNDLGVAFTQEPEERGSATTAVFDDTCGNLIQIADAGSV